MAKTRERLTAEWQALQAKYLEAYQRHWDFDIDLRVKYGTESHRYRCLKSERNRLERMQAAISRALDRIMVWLDRESLWDWHAGASCHWICTKLTAEQAFSPEPPLLPAEAASYGMPHRPFYPARRTYDYQAARQDAPVS